MALEDILKEIEERAKAQASEIEEEARKEADSIIGEAEDKAKALVEKAKEDAERRKKEEMERTRAIESIERKKRILAQRRALIERVIEKSIEKLRGTKEYESFMKRISELSRDADRVVINREDRKFFGRTKAIEIGDIKGGAIITKGEVTMDYSLEGFLEESRDELEREVEEELFGGE
jgi:V/A-type H+-transporting ATPase subunit E